MKKSLTKEGLKQLIRKQVKESKFGAVDDVTKVKASETDADELADSLEKHVDMVAALKIEEARCVRRLKTIRETITKKIALIRNSK